MIPPQVELKPEATTSNEIDVEEPAGSSLSVDEDANYALEEKANDTVILEPDSLLDDVVDNQLYGTRFETPGSTENLNVGEVPKNDTNTPKPSSEKQRACDKKASSGKRNRRDSTSESETTIHVRHSNKIVKKPKIAQQNKQELLPIEIPSTGANFQTMLWDF